MYAELDSICIKTKDKNSFPLYFFPLMKKVTKKSRLILIYLNSTLSSIHAPRPLSSLGAYHSIQFELLRKLKVCRFGNLKIFLVLM